MSSALPASSPAKTSPDSEDGETDVHIAGGPVDYDSEIDAPTTTSIWSGTYDDSDQETAINVRARYVEAWKVGPHKFIKAILEDEKITSTLKNLSPSVLFCHTFLIMITTSEDILNAWINGDIPQRYFGHASDPIKTALDGCWKQCEQEEHPSICANFLVSSDGIPPTTKEYFEMIKLVRRYAATNNDNKDWKICSDIDRVSDHAWRDNDNKQGIRKHLWDPQMSTVIGNRTETLLGFCDYAEELCNSVPKVGWHDPLPSAPCAFGYSNKPCNQIRQNKQQASSYHIMNILDSVCLSYFPKYEIRSVVVHNILSDWLAGLSEIVFTRGGCGYTSCGLGMSHTFAGRSNASADKISDDDWKLLSEKVIELSKPSENAQRMLAVIRQAAKNKKEGDQINTNMNEWNSLLKQIIPYIEGTVERETSQKQTLLVRAKLIAAEYQLAHGHVRDWTGENWAEDQDSVNQIVQYIYDHDGQLPKMWEGPWTQELQDIWDDEHVNSSFNEDDYPSDSDGDEEEAGE